MVDQAHRLSEHKTEGAKRRADGSESVRREKKQISRLAVHGSNQLLHFFFRHEFGKRTLAGAVFMNGNIRKAFRPVCLCRIDKLVDFLARHASLALCINAADNTAVFERPRKDAEAAALHRFRDVPDLHAESQVRLVGTVAVHRILPGNAADAVFTQIGGRCFDPSDQLFIKAEAAHDGRHLLKQECEKSCVDIDDILLIHEGEFHIHLREFGLSVRAQVFIPEAPGDLIVAVKPGAHEELLQ